MIRKLLFLVLLSPLLLSCQNSISGEFSPASDYDFVILYHLTPTGKVYSVDTKIDDKGKFKLDLDSKVKEGFYRLVYKLPEEEHYLDLIYNGKEDVKFTFSEEEGVTFLNGQNKVVSEYLQDMDAVQEEINSKLASGKATKEEIELLFKRQLQIQAEAEQSFGKSLASSVIKSMKPYIPEDFVNKDMYEINRNSEFFNNFDFQNVQLQSSGFPLMMIEKYYFNYVTRQEGSGYRSAINDINLAIKNTDPAFQKSLLTNFWQNLTDQNRNNAATYLSQQYLMDLAESLEDTELFEKLELIKNLSLGAKAPNFTLTDYDNNKTLNDIEGSKFYILAFWSTECSHCLKHIPELHEKIKALSVEKIKVIAVGLELEEEAWGEKIKEFPEFINVLTLGNSMDEIVKTYNVTGTPRFYVLDRDKNIIAKPRGMDNLYRGIDVLAKQQL